jgi:hypothetical protein
MGRRVAGGLLVALAFTLAPPMERGARAQAMAPGDPRDEARRAYAHAAHMFDAGDYAPAAHEFARADGLAPNPVALEFALDAATRAGEGPLAMELCDRAAARALGGRVATLATAARVKFRASMGRLVVTCPAAAACRVRLDGDAVPLGEAQWVLAGIHRVEIAQASGREERPVEVLPGATLEISPSAFAAPAAPAAGAAAATAPVPAPPPEPERRSTLPFWIAAGVTAVGAVLTGLSGADTAQRHTAFLADPTADGRSGGQAAQLRTNVGFGVTAALGVTTAALGVWTFR